MRTPLLSVVFFLLAVPVLASNSPTGLLSMKAENARLGDLGVAYSLVVELPNGVLTQAYARASHSAKAWDGKTVVTWEGQLASSPESELTLTQKAGLTVGTLRVSRDRWYLFPDGKFKRIDPTAALPCGVIHSTSVPPDVLAKVEAETKAGALVSTIDVLGVYDDSFVEAAGGVPQAELLITDAIVRANQAERNSFAGAQYQLTGLVKLTSPIPPHDPLSALLSPTVKNLRNQFGADLVQGYTLRLYADSGTEIAGISTGYHGAEGGFASVVGYYAIHLETPAHELGHNRGADHEQEYAQEPPPARPFGYCPPDGSKGWGTIMWSGLSRPPGHCIWETINYFSNPFVVYRTTAIGVADQQDNARVMRATAPQLAAYRSAHVTATHCTPDELTLCLNHGRFQVTGTFQVQDGPPGQAHVVSLTDETGYLWFFSPQNVEAVVKVLDACSFNEKFWVFAGGLTNVRTGITITDTQTGVRWASINPQGTAFQPIQDTSAFSTCP